MNPLVGVFKDQFEQEPGATKTAPGRVNLLGDHTDYNDGFVLPTALPHRTMVEVGFGAGQHEAYSATLRRRIRFGADTELEDFGRYVGGCLRVLQAEGIPIPPLRIAISSDVPTGAGLSSSAALEVATIRAVAALLEVDLDPVRIAELAQQAEIEHAGVNCGIMDQMASCLAHTDTMLFLDTRSRDWKLLPLPAGAELLVIDSGMPRDLASSGYNERRGECERAATMLGVPTLRDVPRPECLTNLPEPLRSRALHVVTENARVRAALGAAADEFGRLMNASHGSLRDQYAVSAPPVDALVAALQGEASVYGARMTGAGFGGACVALVRAGAAKEIAARVLSRSHSGNARIVVPRPHPS